MPTAAAAANTKNRSRRLLELPRAPASVATRFMTETQTFWPSLPNRGIIIK